MGGRWGCCAYWLQGAPAGWQSRFSMLQDGTESTPVPEAWPVQQPRLQPKLVSAAWLQEGVSQLGKEQAFPWSWQEKCPSLWLGRQRLRGRCEVMGSDLLVPSPVSGHPCSYGRS